MPTSGRLVEFLIYGEKYQINAAMPIFSFMSGGNFYRRYIKEVLDRLGALILLLILLPFGILVAITVAIDLKRNPIFIQQRVGQHERLFPMVKLRTMKINHEEASMTGLGKFIRSISADEWPQLLNVLIGNMSIIGPRPLLEEYLPYYTKEEHHRHDVKPGITGWAQVNGRNKIDWGKRMELDLYYVHHCSIWLDVRILMKTFAAILHRDKTSYKDDKTVKFSEFASRR